MCGIVGFLKINNIKFDLTDESSLRKMTNTLSHRGPDHQNIWIEDNIYLGHTRLSIIDLSKNGNQPMISHSGRYVITFNGEIYNFKKLKSELGKNINWRSETDTEVLLECIEHWGLEKTLNSARGMFAFALWDRRNKNLIIAKDRIGEKPLYYGMIKGNFVFSSELKALRSIFKKELQVSKDSMNLMLRFGYVPSPNSIYKNIFKLKAGHFFKVLSGKLYENNPSCWFNPLSTILLNRKTDNLINNEKKLHEKLSLAVKEQMVSDVPLGAMLSGGIDSSLIVALMQEHSSTKIKTFTIGFNESIYDEAKYAKKISEHLNTEHHELYVDPNHAINLIPKIPTIYDEPFGDSSQIPSVLISELTSKSVKVCLSGDGGDELFGGYNRYIWSNTLLKTLEHIPLLLKNLISSSCYTFSSDNWNNIFKILYKIIPFELNVNNVGDKIHKLGELISFNSKEDLYYKMVSQWRKDIPTLHEYDDYNFFKNSINWEEKISYIENMMLIDTLTYLPDDILVKVDRAAMSFGLETRVPFLDYRVFKEAWKIPIHSKISRKKGKLPLRNILKKYLPSHLIERPKQGFSIPIESWLKTSLKDWAEDLLEKNKLEDNIFYDHIMIRKKWEEHLSGKHNWHYPLWNVLMLQSWLES